MVDLIIDGNYVLNKIVYYLDKHNILFGALYKSLENSVSSYKKWYPFTNVYFVSDSKGKSWRRKLNENYKKKIKKPDNIDWEFVFNTYDEFKNNIQKNYIKVLESNEIEGDDWISFITEKSNKSGNSVVIVTNDYDIKQLINFDLSKKYINFITNEMYNKQKIFLPKNYKVYLNHIKNMANESDIFNLNDDLEFYNLLTNFIERYEVVEVDPIETLIIKFITGDISDNISPCWQQTKDGKKRGIAKAGAKTIFNEYIMNFGDPKLSDPDLTENIADLICEKKKLSKSQIFNIKKNIEMNMKLILLDTNQFPDFVIEKMRKVFSEKYG